jgi:hypothetical protein
MTKQRRSNQKQRTQTQGRSQKTLLNSVKIRTSKDTNILQKDIFREYLPDSANSDQGYLVNNRWVRFFGQEGSFLKGLIAGISNSPTKRNIISQKTTLSLGDGFLAVKADKVPFLHSLRKMLRLSKADDNSIDAMNELISNVNLHNESLEEVMEKLFFDYYSFGNAIAEFKKATRNGQPIVYLYHVPIENAAIEKVNSNGIVKNIGICNSWDNDGLSDKDIRVVPIYPEFKNKSSVVHIKDYAPNFFYWGIPSNIAGRFWAEIEYRIPKYNITKFKNGFLPSAIIQAYGSFTTEEANELADSFKETFSDTENGSRLLLQILRNKTDAADIQIIDDKSEGNFIELQNLATQQIITSEGWFPSISGIATPGKLGSSQELKDGIELAINMKIKPIRRKFLQKIINPFIKENKDVNGAIKGTMLTIANSNPISLASSIIPNDALSRNEQREILGYEPEETQEPQNIEE